VQSLARGLGQGEGGLIQSQYNQNVANQLGAANSLYGAGNSTAGLLSNLDQTRLANMQAGINAADAANNAQMWGPQQMLQVEAAPRHSAARRSIGCLWRRSPSLRSPAARVSRAWARARSVADCSAR
jgi:hypothetical protein